MADVLRDPNKVKSRKDGMYPWDSTPYSKDKMHDGFLSQGSDFGVGYRQPVGKESASSIESGPIPQKAKCFSPKESFDADKRG